MVSKNIELRNELNNIVVDENYSVPMLIAKGRVKTSQNNYFPPPAGYTFQWYYATYPWRMSKILAIVPLNEVDIDGLDVALSQEEIDAIVKPISNSLIVAGRCLSGDYAFRATAAVVYDVSAKKIRVMITAECEKQDAEVEIVVFATQGLKPSNETLATFDADGKLLFDVRKPPMLFLGSLYGGLSVWNVVAGTYNINLPEDVDANQCYITSRSGAPFYAAYNIHAGGVGYGQTNFKTVMSFPNPNLMRVQVVRANYVEGSNSAYGYGGFFENAIYCPYPHGVYI